MARMVPEGVGIAVNRRWNGPPDRRAIGTPVEAEDQPVGAGLGCADGLIAVELGFGDLTIRRGS